MENLDLDIGNYNIKDIEKFFRFKPGSKYTASDIELREYEIREQLLNSGHINKRFKRDLIEFLSLAKDWLIYVKCKPNEKQPTTIPKNYKLDTLDTPLSEEVPNRIGELTIRPDTQYIHTQNSDFFPGVMNPLSTRVITKCLNIDTRFRDNIYTTKCTDFTINLPMKFSKVVSMQLAALEFPVTFYGISEELGNDFIYIEVNYNALDDSGEVLDASGTYYIADGNYNSSDVIETLNSQLRPVNENNELMQPDSIFSYVQFVIDVTSNGSGSGKVSIYPDGDKASYINLITLDFTRGINGEVDNVPLTTKLGWNLGFQKSLYNDSTSYTADTIVEPSNVRYVYLIVDDFNKSANNHFISAFNKSVLNPNILARIAIKGSYFSIIMGNDFNITSEPRKYFGPVDIQRLKIQIIDEYGKILNMNNSNFSFCLNLKMLYDL